MAEVILQRKEKSIHILGRVLDVSCVDNAGNEDWTVLIIAGGNDLQNIHVSWQLWPHLDFLSLTKRQIIVIHAFVGKGAFCRYRWPRGLRRGSAATRWLGLRVRIPPGA